MTRSAPKLADTRTALTLASNFWYDFRRFARASFVYGRRNQENQRAMIHILFHSIEHGLSLPEPRPGFGREKVDSLIRKTESYIAEFGPDRSTESALSALDGWIAFNRSADVDVDDVARNLDRLNAESAFRQGEASGGAEEVTAEEIARVSTQDFEAFMAARHSVRQYAPRLVTAAEIEAAVRAAQQTPTVCNRQTCRVYAFTDPDEKEKVLSYQSGNRGFGHEVGVVLIITSNMEHMNLIGERYQHWIDGGMFAMTLALAFHAAGMGACMLNWSVTKDIDMAMRKCVGIPDSEAVITLMGAGHLKEHFRVPVSQRKPLGDILSLNPPIDMNAPGVTLE
ncbi:MAG: nitroreductase [Hyphomicrobiales bacterium]|nr:nitroreductase [Hyphomicrobiales bacterium]